jgi:hypothetical protein
MCHFHISSYRKSSFAKLEVGAAVELGIIPGATAIRVVPEKFLAHFYV